MNLLFYSTSLILFIFACDKVKNSSSLKEGSSFHKEKSNSDNVISFLPLDIADKEWVLLNQQIHPIKNIKTQEKYIFLDFIEYRKVKIKKVKIREKGFDIYIDQICDFIKFRWINKSNHISKWELKYEDDKSILEEYITIEKGFNISDEEKNKILKNYLSHKSTGYNESENIVGYEGYYQCSDEDGIVHIISSDNIELKLNESFWVTTTSKKIKGFKNRYDLFLKEDLTNYSTNESIAELNFISDEEITKTWFGLLNLNTGKRDFDIASSWNKEECDTLYYWY